MSDIKESSEGLAEPSAIANILSALTTRVAQDVFGQERAIRQLTMALLAGGHVLLEGPPGVAKTLLAKTFARATGLSFNRIQFTPDLMPSDITGVYLYDQSEHSFRLSPGPIFADVVLADEINRTPPKTQSALLEAMQEHFVTIDGKRHPLGTFFFVIATQNPIEHEGTYPLPEAQLDRFFIKVKVGYPSAETEVRLFQELSSEDLLFAEFCSNAPESERKRKGNVALEELESARSALRQVRLDNSLTTYVQRIVAATRTHPDVLLGASPRAGLHVCLAAKCNAAFDGRNYVIPDDIKSQVSSVLAHRLVLRPEVFPDPTHSEQVLQHVLSATEIPEVYAAPT